MVLAIMFSPTSNFSEKLAVLQIREEAVELSLSIASKLIRRNLTKEDNQALIDEALKQVESRQVQ